MKELSKANQIEAAVKAFEAHTDKLSTTEDWLESLAYCKSDEEFAKVGSPICDAIVFPKCDLLFPYGKQPFKAMKMFFKKQGIPVRAVYQAVKKDCVFLQLKESRNQFTPQLIEGLRKAVSVLTLSLYGKLRRDRIKHNSKHLLVQLQNLYIRQIDFTQDISGFAMFLDLFPLLKEYGNLIGMAYSKEYN